MADNTISPVVPNVSGGRNVSTGQKAVTQTAAQSGIDFKSYLGGRTAVQDNSTTFLKRRNSYTLNKNNTKEISIKTASKNSPTESEVKKITDDISSQIVEKVTDTPLSVIYTATELNSAVAEYEQADVIFVDTAGFSHKNETQRNDMRALLAGLSPEYEKSVYLVLSATTKYRDLISIIDSYKDIDDYKLIFTKLDETSSYGNLLNIKLYSDAGISYVTNGQNVPDDIEVFDTQKIVKQLLGGRQ